MKPSQSLEQFFVGNPLIVSPEMTLGDVVALMEHARSTQWDCNEEQALLGLQRSSCVIVVEQSKPLSVITEKDIVSLVAQAVDFAAVSVVEKMSNELVVLPRIDFNSNEALIEIVSQAFRQNRYRPLPLVDNEGHIAGLLTLELWQQFLENQVMQMQQMLQKQQEVKASLSYRLQFESLITSISNQFVRLGQQEFDAGISQALADIGKFLLSDRSYVFLLSQDGVFFSNTHEWCAPGVSPQIDHLQQLLVDEFSWSMSRLRMGEMICCNDLAILPPEAANEKAILEAQGIQSLVLAPILCNQVLWGFIGFDSVRSARIWEPDSITLLKVVGEIFANLLARQQVEHALSRSTATNRALLDALPDLVLRINRDYVIVNYKAPRNFRLLLPPEQFLGKTLFEVLPEAISQPAFEAVRKTFVTNETQSLEYSLTFDGKDYFYEARFANSDLDEVIAIIRDISDSKRAELKLIAARDHLQTVIDTMPGFVLWISCDLKYLGVNRKFAEVFQRSPEEFLNQPIDSIGNEFGLHDFFVNCFAEGCSSSDTEIEINRNGKRQIYLLIAQPYQKQKSESIIVVGVEITQLKETQDYLQRQLEAIEASVDGIAFLVFLDNNYVFQYLNPALIRMFGYERQEDLIGRSWRSLYRREEVRRIEEDILPLLSREGSWKGELTAKRVDGKIFLQEISLSINSDGSLIAVSRDVTQRRKAEEVNRKIKEQLELLIQASNDGFWDWDFETNQIYFSPRWKEMLGYRDDELPNAIETWDSLIFETDRAIALQLLDDYNSSKVPRFDMVQRFYHKNGSTVYVLSRAIHLKNVDGQVTRMLGAHTDITELVKMQQALTDSEKKYRSVVDTIAETLFQIDCTGNFIFLNPAWCELTGYSVEESLNTNFVEYIYPEDRQKSLECFYRLVSNEQANCRLDVRCITQDGETRWVDVVARTVEERGIVVGVAGALSDITIRKLSEEKMLVALERERELNELRSRFISVTSHEFRTPLTVIASSAGILEEYGDQVTPDHLRRHLRRIHNKVVEMDQLLDDILFISRDGAGKLSFNPTIFDEIQFCREIVEDIQSSTIYHRIVLQVTTDRESESSESMQPYLDQHLLRQILSNLLSNAVKYSPEGGNVYFELLLDSEKTVFRVSDEGIGIPTEDLPYIFDEFHRARNIGVMPGTGLGLAVTRRCVDLHKGRIHVESALGKGTTFTVTIPKVLL